MFENYYFLYNKKFLFLFIKLKFLNFPVEDFFVKYYIKSSMIDYI